MGINYGISRFLDIPTFVFFVKDVKYRSLIKKQIFQNPPMPLMYGCPVIGDARRGGGGGGEAPAAKQGFPTSPQPRDISIGTLSVPTVSLSSCPQIMQTDFP